MPKKPSMSARSCLRRTFLDEMSVEPVLFLFSFCFYTNSAILKNMTLTKICNVKFENVSFCRNTSNPDIGKDDFVQSVVSHWQMYLTITGFLSSVTISLYAGSWGDKFGRKFPLLLPPIGLFISSVSFALFDLNIAKSPLWSLLLAQLAQGIFGGEMVMISASVAYIVTVCAPDQKVQRLSVLQSTIIFGATVGPFLSNIVRENSGDYGVFIMTASAAALCFLYTLLVLRNVPPKDGGIAMSLKELWRLDHLKDSLVVAFRPRESGVRQVVLILVGFTAFHFYNDSGNLLAIAQWAKTAILNAF